MKRVEFILFLVFVGMVGAVTKKWKPEDPIARTAVSPDISFNSIAEVHGNISVIRKIDDSLFIGCKDRVVIVDAAAIGTGSTKQNVKPTQVIDWSVPELEVVKAGIYKPEKCGKDPLKKDCGNFIRLIERINGTNVMICGTGGGKNTGACKIFEWDGHRLGSSYEMQAEGQGSEFGTSRLLSYDFNSELIWTYSDRKLFLGHISPAPKLFNVLIESGSNGQWIISFEPTVYTKNGRQLSQSARFAGIVEANETAYLFLYENSMDNCDQRAGGEESKKTGARVARVCKNDPGNLNTFTTFFKARLNCFDKRVIPYSYYEEVQQVKGFYQVNGVPMVFGVFVNPHKQESAVCVYSEEQLNPGTDVEFDVSEGGCWNKAPSHVVPSSKPKSSWTACDGKAAKDAALFPKKTLLHKPVNKEGTFPIFTKKETLFSAIAAETNVAMKTTQNISIVYIGTTDGQLITVSVDQANVAREGDVPPSVIVSDTQNVFNEDQCLKKQYKTRVIPNQKKVLDIEVFDEHVVVTFLHCAIRVPKAQCDRYTCQSFCINSGNPSCGLLNGECVKKTEDNEKDMEQGFEVSSDEVSKCRKEKMRILDITGTKKEMDVTMLVLVIFLSLISVLFVTLLLWVFCRAEISSKLRSLRRKTSAGQSREDNEYRDIPSDAAALSEKQAKKHTRVNFYPRKSNEIQYPGITVEASTLPLRYKPSIIKRESVKFEDDFPEPQPKYSAIPIFQNMKRGSKHEDVLSTDGDGDEELEMRPTTSNTGKHNTNNNRVSLHTDGLDFSDSLIYSNARFSLKGLSTTQQQFYGAVDCGQPKSNPLTLNSPVYSSLSPLFSRDPVVNESKFGGPSREASPMKALVHPDPTFPPLPACAVLPASAGVVKMASFSGKTTCLQKPTTPLSSEQPGESKKSLSGEQQSLSTSGSADSTSSGFISASSGEQQQNQQHQQDKAAAEISAQGKRKAFIVAKGLLSAQTLASPISPKFMRKHKRVSRQSSGEELRYSIARSSVFLEGERTTSSEYLGSLNDLPLFKNPEYRDSSEDEEDDEEEGCDDQQHQRQNMMQRIEDGLAKKHRRRPLKLFRSKIPGRRPRKGSEPLSMLDGGCSGHSIDDDEIFASPSYADDEDTIVPQVIGWEEIDYTPLGLSLESTRMTTPLDLKPPRAFADNRGHSFDDIDVKTSFTDASSPMVNGAKDITFLTLRPRNRMRQRLPKMRNTEKEWALSGSPKPVPTPSLPRDVIQ